jgi:GT2 family glycosyltransferase
MKIAIGSIFRNSESYIYRYLDQIMGLRVAAPQHDFELLLVEGDSTDGTRALLDCLFFDAVTTCAHGGPLFGSVDNTVRWRQSSFVWESVLQRISFDTDIFLYVESDLTWQPETMLRLIEHTSKYGVDVVVPMCFRSDYHYDTWGLRGVDGNSYGCYPPYHKELLEPPSPNGLFQIQSAGSCLVMRGAVARTCHFDPADLAIVGFCRNAAEQGYQLWLDPTLKVYHP